MPQALLLASSSSYRRALLERLGIAFEQASPDVDESRRPGEPADRLVQRLAAAKADALARPASWIIGSDQLATLEGDVLGKPGSPERACEQLRRCSGKRVEFLTAVCLRGPERAMQHMDRTVVSFRALTDDEIERYVAAERPLDSAGSFKCEGLGISLFSAIESRDPTALIGLPLIALSRMLREAGFRIP